MKIILGLGSNIGNRVVNIDNAIVQISKIFNNLKISKIYETISMLKDDQQNYLNCIVTCEYDSTPITILSIIKKIEIDIGRVRTKRWGERLIDIDIIDIDRLIIDSKELTLPHIGLHIRSFVLYPMSDVVDNYVHPAYNKSLETMISELKDDFGIKTIN